MMTGSRTIVKQKRSRYWPSDQGPQRKRKPRHVRFCLRPHTIGRADSKIDRRSMPIQLYLCDVCGSKIHAGLKGFELYASCALCEYDLCLNCWEASERWPRYKVHPHPLSIVNRNRDHEDSDEEYETCEEDEEEIPFNKKQKTLKSVR